MSRLIVPRGNRIDPPFRVYPLDCNSPCWELLGPDEQRAATLGVAERPVMHTTMAARTLWECLGDARRAPTGSDWEVRRDRLRRVKAAVLKRLFGGREDDASRERWQVGLVPRLILLGVSRDAAVAAASQAIEFTSRCMGAGEVPPPRFGTYAPKWEETLMRFHRFDEPCDRVASQQVWDAEGAMLTAGQHLTVRESLDDELRAFAPEPDLDEFLLARGEPFLHRFPDWNSTRLSAPEDALKHALHLVSVTQAIVWVAKQAAGGRPNRSAHELGENAYRHCMSLRRVYGEHSIDEALLLDYSVHRDAPFEFPAVIKPTVHEAAVELARLVGLALRERVELDAPCSFDYIVEGPWEGSEVAAALARFVSEREDLCAAFDAMSVQRLEAELKLEARRAIARRDSPANRVVSGTTERNPKTDATSKGCHRGRPYKNDPRRDKNICDAYEAGTDVERLVKEFAIDRDDVKKAVKRHREKRSREDNVGSSK